MTMLQKMILSTILGGLIFSGFMSGVKIVNDTCVWNTTCPYFFGYPACYTGFLMYLVLFIVFLTGTLRKKFSEKLFLAGNVVSFLGVLFSGKFAAPEFSTLFREGVGAFAQSVPLCAIGFIFFVLIFVLGVVAEMRCTNGICE